MATGTIRRGAHVVYRDLEEGGVLLDLESGAYFGVNPVGALVWRLLEGEPDATQLLASLGHVLDGGLPDAAVAEIHEFVDELRRRNLVDVGQRRARGVGA